MEAFVPRPSATVNINVSASSQRVALGSARGRQQVRICNAGTATVWLSFGGSTVTAATATGMPIPAGAIEVVTLADYGEAPQIAAIAAGSTGVVYFTPGEGF